MTEFGRVRQGFWRGPDAAVPEGVLVNGRLVPLSLRRSARARRMLLRIDPGSDGVELVLPGRVSTTQGLRFLEAQQAWIAEHLAALPPRLRFLDGADLPLWGVAHRLCWHPDLRGRSWCGAGEIHVVGPADHLERRARDWLKAEASRVLGQKVRALAATRNLKVSRISLRDTTSRWGSCSAKAAISLSWRLVFAPAWVADYVVAHEVAHLQELNHGSRFWAAVAEFGVEPGPAKAWLKAHGAVLQRYG